jgi:pimeloyl-ACP methyl ester carboxylesterase
MDLRGHGQSGGRDKLHSWRIEDYVNDVLAALRRWESIRILVGHSMGGLVAQLVAGEAALDRLVLVAPSPTEGMLRNGIRMAIAHPWTFAAAYLQRSFKRLYANRRVARALLFHPNGREEIVDRHLATVEEESWLAGNEMTSLLPDPSRVKCAVTVIAGERDFMVDRRATERTARDYGTVLRVFAGCGHMVPIEADAAELARAIVGPAAGLS